MVLFLSSFVVFLTIGVPIALALGLGAAAYLVFTGNPGLLLAFPQRLISGIDQFVLLTIPLFLLAGNLMNSGGITDRIVRFSRAYVGQVRGGLSMVTVVASMFFSGVSGAATAEAAALGAVLIPAMEKEGYDRDYAAALTAVSSVIGPIIPPSIIMIIYAVLSGTSIAALFLAGIVPGIMLGGGLMAYAWWVAKRRDYPVSRHVKMTERAVATVEAFPALMVPVIILGGILSGMFTPTESAAVAVIYTFLISAFLYRTLKWRELWRPLVDTAMVSSGIMVIVAMASMVSFVFAFESIPARIAGAMMQLTADKTLLLLLINGFLLVLGMFLEPIAAMILSMPVLITVVHALHMDLTHFGMIVVLNLVIGLATPPVGLCLFIVCSIGRVPFEQVSRASLPMLGICIVVLLLVTFFPDLVLFIPHLFLGPER